MSVGRSTAVFVMALALAVQTPARAAAQTAESGGEVTSSRPFSVGERLIYSVKVGPIGRGNAVAELRSLDTLRGKLVYHSVFTMNGSLLFFRVDDEYESWFDPRTFVSLRYRQQ